MRLNEILLIPRGATAVVGGGGKTTLIWRLALELSVTSRVVIATTTRIWPPDCLTLLSPDRDAIEAAFGQTRLIAVGEPTPEGKLGNVPGLNEKTEGLADYVLIEADGSRGLPLKAPAEHEPVIPPETGLTIAVAGMSCAGLTLAKAAHRPARYAALVGSPEESPVTPEKVACGIGHPNGQKKGVVGRFVVVLNQTDTAERLAFAREVARRLSGSVILLALQTRPDWAECWRDGKRLSEKPNSQL